MSSCALDRSCFRNEKNAQRNIDKIKWTRTEMWCQTQNIVYSNSILCSPTETFCVTITSFGFIFSLSPSVVLSLRWLTSCIERAVDSKIFEPNNHAKTSNTNNSTIQMMTNKTSKKKSKILRNLCGLISIKLLCIATSHINYTHKWHVLTSYWHLTHQMGISKDVA